MAVTQSSLFSFFPARADRMRRSSRRSTVPPPAVPSPRRVLPLLIGDPRSTLPFGTRIFRQTKHAPVGAARPSHRDGWHQQRVPCQSPAQGLTRCTAAPPGDPGHAAGLAPAPGQKVDVPARSGEPAGPGRGPCAGGAAGEGEVPRHGLMPPSRMRMLEFRLKVIERTTTPSACNQLSNSERLVPVALRTSTVAILRSGGLTSLRVCFASAQRAVQDSASVMSAQGFSARYLPSVSNDASG